MPYTPANYLPSPEEIRHRSMILRMMQIAQWDSDFINSVLMNDHPTTHVVLDLVRRYGRDEAYKRLLEFIS